MIREAIRKTVQGQNLGEEEMLAVMERITHGEATPAQVGALLAGLRMKGETAEEISGAARVLKSRCLPLPSGNTGTLVDTCGTEQGAVAPKRTWGPLIFILKFKFL